MKTVADVMGVARSNLAEKARRDQQAPSPESPFPRGPYAKPEDIVLCRRSESWRVFVRPMAIVRSRREAATRYLACV